MPSIGIKRKGGRWRLKSSIKSLYAGRNELHAGRKDVHAGQKDVAPAGMTPA